MPANNLFLEEATPQVEDILKLEETTPIVEADIAKVEPEIFQNNEERNLKGWRRRNQTNRKCKKGDKEMLSTMATIEKVITQVQCQACGKSMSANNFKL